MPFLNLIMFQLELVGIESTQCRSVLHRIKCQLLLVVGCNHSYIGSKKFKGSICFFNCGAESMKEGSFEVARSLLAEELYQCMHYRQYQTSLGTSVHQLLVCSYMCHWIG